MIESPLVREWKSEAEVKAKVDWLLRVAPRCVGPVPSDVAAGIRACGDAKERGCR